ncbi:hypothetical protein [uncultured Ramlibacter sp.]|uniref:BP74-related protein n=1 Tax=uncultured Ramlibacter sp. TaxID=260755 RepID=UPI002611EE47|nr:hypothetical protein [uncultured Ramlibacter sp.]
MLARRLFLLAASCLLASCGGGGGDGGQQPEPEVVTFAFRIQGAGEEQEFRYATSSQEFIAKARAQLSLPVVGRPQFPAGPIAAGSNGVNLNWNWHFTDLSFTESAMAACDGTPALVEVDLPNWLRSVGRFCPWSGYVYAEVKGSHTLRGMAVGETREIAQETMRIEFKDVSDSRCGAAQMCITPGAATAQFNVRIGAGAAQPVTLVLDASQEAQQAVVGGYRLRFERLDPYPINAPYPKEQYRATLSVRKL